VRSDRPDTPGPCAPRAARRPSAHPPGAARRIPTARRRIRTGSFAGPGPPPSGRRPPASTAAG